MKNDRLITQTQYGYFTIANKPSIQELEEYYASVYYQGAAGGYEQDYTDEEITYFKNKIAQKYHVIKSTLLRSNDTSFLDVGCGEGWTLSFFKAKGWNVTGIDYSTFGCEKFNPDCLSHLIAGNLYENLVKLAANGSVYDVIWLDNVLEHVLDPEDLVSMLKKLIKPCGVLVVEVPNDFSLIQKYALDKGYVDHEFWIVPPDHISYFNKKGLKNLFESHGWSSKKFLADFPIDWQLLNPDSNYIKDRSKGKNCHRQRIELDNIIAGLDITEAVAFYESLANLGLGRQITGFFSPTEA